MKYVCDGILKMIAVKQESDNVSKQAAIRDLMAQLCHVLHSEKLSDPKAVFNTAYDIYMEELKGVDVKCRYCGGNCPNEPDDSEYLCDGFAGDIDSLYEDDEDYRNTDELIHQGEHFDNGQDEQLTPEMG